MNPARIPMTPLDAHAASIDRAAAPAGLPLWWCLVLVGSLGFGVLSLALRPLLPVDETRYLAVAWEMWQRGQLLVPMLNGELYDHKPPLLFWLIHAGWALGGVGETWPRLVGPLATLAGTWLLARLGRQLWPQRPQVGQAGSLMFLSTVFVGFFGTALMFDLPLLVFVCLGWLGLHRAAQSGRWRHWAGYGLAFAAALLTKGPVAAVYLLPPLLMLRVWAPRQSTRTGLRIGLALAIALLPPLGWLLWADAASSGQLLQRVLLDQTLGRVHGDLGHPRPFFWYLPWLPLLALPWVLWSDFRRGLRRAWRERDDPGLRFIATIGLSGLVVLSLVGGKQVHYLIPLLAVSMLAAAHGLPAAADASRVLRRAGISMVVIGLGMGVGFVVLAPRYDLAAASEHAGREQRAGRPVLYVGNYQGEFGFLGRMRAPVQELPPEAAGEWMRRHPEGLVITRRKRLAAHGQPRPEFVQRYKGEDLLMFRAADLMASGSGFREPAKDAAR